MLACTPQAPACMPCMQAAVYDAGSLALVLLLHMQVRADSRLKACRARTSAHMTSKPSLQHMCSQSWAFGTCATPAHRAYRQSETT